MNSLEQIEILKKYYDELVKYGECDKSMDETIKKFFKNNFKMRRRDNIRSMIFDEIRLVRNFLNKHKNNTDE